MARHGTGLTVQNHQCCDTHQRRWPGTGRSGQRELPLNEEEERQTRVALAQLRQEHRDLDSEIRESGGAIDPITLQRMKKRKLMLKDRITALEDRLLPDIIA